MLTAAEILFWTSLYIILYTYAGYPLLVFFLVQIKKIFWKSTIYTYKKEQLPEVTLIITAFNEEKIIEEKINNSLQLDYSQKKLNIILITDGSTDNTNAIVRRYSSITLLFEPGRKGKLAAMNRAMQHVHSAIVIFSDANTLLNKDSIQKIVSHYNDEKVGGVAGEKRIYNEENYTAKGEGLYWQYESLLKKLDASLYTVVGAAGELFSLRSDLYTPLPEHIIIEDFVQSLLLCKKGYKVAYEPGAYATERASLSIEDEMERKIRISAGGFQAMVYLKSLLNVLCYPIVSFQYISHRLLRWTLCPLSLVLVFISSAFIYIYTSDPFFAVIILAQFLFYTAAFVGWRLALKKIKFKLLYLPFYFTFMNLCVFAGFLRYSKGTQQAIWQKAARPEKI